MADIPPEMMTRGRAPVQEFPDDEFLYRRFHPDNVDGGEIAIDAVELPDVSVNRARFGPPEWLLLDEGCAGWGVLAFRVRDIPPRREVWHEGVVAYTLEPRHVPLHNNYPHSEVWVFREGVHIVRGSRANPGNLHLLDPDFHLRWRECIVFASHVVIQPS
jgi:hypothetical protein